MIPTTTVHQQGLLFSDLEVRNYDNFHANKVRSYDFSVHDWYRFVLSFPPHLVRDYIGKFGLEAGQTLLDPFCGTGTTLVEAKLHGLRSFGIEANKMAYFASSVKCDWNVDVYTMLADARQIVKQMRQSESKLREKRTFSEDEECLLLKDSIDPDVLHDTILLRDIIRERGMPHENHLLLALATSTVRYCSRIHFGPEVGVSKKKKFSTDVNGCWLGLVEMMGRDIDKLPKQVRQTQCSVLFGDARNAGRLLKTQSVDAVFTSPPYPNEKDYTRTTRLESVLLGFLSNKNDLREMKENLLRSNSRNIYKDDTDDVFVANNQEITDIADRIEARRLKLGKTSGFEKQYHRIVRHYFGGMARHLKTLKPSLKPGAMLGYVVGDQASFLQIHIPTGKILGDIAVEQGYTIVSIDLFRTRFATVTKKNMNEEVVVLRWNG